MLTLAHGPAAPGGRNTPISLRSTRLLFVVLFAFCCFAFSLTAAAQQGRAQGRVYGWGFNNSGQIGDGTTTLRTTPFQVNGIANVVSADGGDSHTLALKSDGTVWAWGDNSTGQLGTGNNNDSFTPVQVIGLTGVRAVSAGVYHNLALKYDGTVWAWGDNSRGQLGDGSTTSSNVPKQVDVLTDVVAISAPGSHNLALKSDGTVWTWGYNFYGQIGDITTMNRLRPFQVPGITNAKGISGGAFHSLVLLADGTMKAWGFNSNYQLGDGTNSRRISPVNVTVLSGGVKALAHSSGGHHTLVLMENGTVKGWGANDLGQLGNGNFNSPQITPTTVQGITDVKMLAQGDNHSMALLSDGTVWTWGWNFYGQLGNGTTTDSNIPLNPSLTGIASIGAGVWNSLAVKSIPSVQPGQLIISEFTLRGGGRANDEFIELYNNTNSSITVYAQDGSVGFAVVASDDVPRCVIPNGTIIPARGHFLCANDSVRVGYSLSGYPSGNGTTATPDATYTTDIPDNAGIALFNTSNPANFTPANRLDAVGSTAETNTLYKEGAGYPALTVFANSDQSFYRDLSTGVPKDSDNNGADFLFVDTNGTLTEAGQRLGAPGPENLSSPIQRNGWLTPSLLNPAVSATADPNQVRNTTPVANGTFGTIEMRRRFTNNTGAPVTRLRFRVVKISTFPPPSAGVADLRALSSPTISIFGDFFLSCDSVVTPFKISVQGTTLEQPPVQSAGGGLNSTLSADAVTLAKPLASGECINVRWLLGVEQKGAFSFFVNIELLP